jgi:serine/threonine-protein kinase
LIGTGGMGLVYRVEHIQLGKIAAMKVLHADTARNADAIRRFRTEAQAVSRLSHPNIVQTFDFGQSEGALYLVMEYVRGDDLAVLVKREGPLPFDRAAPLFVQICSALTDAHEAGVIHRDLKPENIVVVTRQGPAAHAKVLDFGLAKLRERADGADITSRGQVIGTPYYMSPEQVRSEVLDVRTDIYSLGATLYRVLTGTPPFEAPTPVGVLTKHITDPLEPPSSRAPGLNLPPAADAIVGRAMAKAREDRYATAAEVQHDLEAALAVLRRTGAAATVNRVVSGKRSTVGDRSAGYAATVDLGPDLAFGRAATERSGHDHERAPNGGRTPDGVVIADEGLDVDGPSSGESGQRLRKQDFDAFERSLRRKKVIAGVSVPAFFLAVLSIGVWTLARGREKASSIEREPNNTAQEATLLPLDVPVEGKIGVRLPGGQPDMDYFRVPAGKGSRIVSARVEGIPAVDLVLEVFDAQGALLAKNDAHGTGGGEWLQPTMIGPAEAYLLVRQVWIQGTESVENVEDPYHLSVHWGPMESGWEIEPNDWRDHATSVEVGHTVKGYLGSAEDQDWFAFTPSSDGYLVGRATAPAGVEIAVTVGDGPQPRHATSGKAEHWGEIKIPVKARERTLVGLTRKLPAGKDPKAEALDGLDAPYELKLDLRSTP